MTRKQTEQTEQTEDTFINELKKKYGFVENTGFDDEPSGFVLEGAEEAFDEALKQWRLIKNTSN